MRISVLPPDVIIDVIGEIADTGSVFSPINKSRR